MRNFLPIENQRCPIRIAYPCVVVVIHRKPAASRTKAYISWLSQGKLSHSTQLQMRKNLTVTKSIRSRSTARALKRAWSKKYMTCSLQISASSVVISGLLNNTQPTCLLRFVCLGGESTQSPLFKIRRCPSKSVHSTDSVSHGAKISLHWTAGLMWHPQPKNFVS